MRSQAHLVGSVLYVDGRVWADDVAPDEAAEIVEELSSYPSGPKWVYFHISTPTRRKRVGTGWPK
jgi:hypothetical protein